jgi:hypothetical protein
MRHTPTVRVIRAAVGLLTGEHSPAIRQCQHLGRRDMSDATNPPSTLRARIRFIATLAVVSTADNAVTPAPYMAGGPDRARSELQSGA